MAIAIYAAFGTFGATQVEFSAPAGTFIQDPVSTDEIHWIFGGSMEQAEEFVAKNDALLRSYDDAIEQGGGIESDGRQYRAACAIGAAIRAHCAAVEA